MPLPEYEAGLVSANQDCHVDYAIPEFQPYELWQQAGRPEGLLASVRQVLGRPPLVVGGGGTFGDEEPIIFSCSRQRNLQLAGNLHYNSGRICTT